MDHNTSYLNTNYARDKMIESYHREEKELEEKNLADMEENEPDQHNSHGGKKWQTN